MNPESGCKVRARHGSCNTSKINHLTKSLILLTGVGVVGKLILIVSAAILKNFFLKALKFEKTLNPYTLDLMTKNSRALEPRNFSLASSPTPAGTSLFNRDDPDSLVNCCEGTLLKAIESVENNKEARRILKLGEKEIRDLKPTAQEMRIRISFWDEHARAIEVGTTMKLNRIFAGLVSEETFFENFLPVPEKMAFLMNIPPAYKAAAQEILHTGLERLRDIIELPLIDSKGRIQGPVISAILKAVDMLDKRINGMALQKIAVHQHSTSGGDPSVQGELAQDQVALLEKQIVDIRKKMGEKYAVIPSARSTDIVVEKNVTDDET